MPHLIIPVCCQTSMANNSTMLYIHIMPEIYSILDTCFYICTVDHLSAVSMKQNKEGYNNRMIIAVKVNIEVSLYSTPLQHLHFTIQECCAVQRYGPNGSQVLSLGQHEFPCLAKTIVTCGPVCYLQKLLKKICKLQILTTWFICGKLEVVFLFVFLICSIDFECC